MANGTAAAAAVYACACNCMNIGFHVRIGRFLLSFVVAAFVVMLFKWNSTAAQRIVLVLVLYLVCLLLFVFVNELLSMDGGSYGVCLCVCIRDCVRACEQADKLSNILSLYCSLSLARFGDVCVRI